MIKNQQNIEQRQGLIEMLLAMLICGTIGATVIISGQKEASLIFFRCFFGSIVLGIICLYKNIFKTTKYTKKFWIISIIGGVALQANWYFLFSAYSKTSIGIATTVYNIQPFIMVFICVILFKERITKVVFFWLVVSFIGLYFISSAETSFPSKDGSYFIGVLEALFAAGLYAVASVAAKYLKGYSPILVAFFQMLLGVVIFLPFADFSIFTLNNGFEKLSATLALGFIHTGLMYIFLYGAIQKLEAYKVASLSFLYPILALIIDKLFFDVQLVGFQIIGVLLILISAMAVNLHAYIIKLRIFSRKNDS